MGKPYPIELRERVINLYESCGYSIRSLSQDLLLGKETVNRWISRYNKTGEIKPKSGKPGKPPKIDETGIKLLKQLLKDQPDLTLEELKDRYNKKSTVSVSRGAIIRALKRANITRKKKFGQPQSKKVTV